MDKDPGYSLISIQSTSENDYISTPLNLLYGSNLGVNEFMDLFNCSVGTARVESDIYYLSRELLHCQPYAKI